MRGLWVAVLSVVLAVSAGAVMQAQQTSTAQGMSRADRKAQRQTRKAEAKAARNNARVAREYVKAEWHRARAGNGGRKVQALAAALTPPPM